MKRTSLLLALLATVDVRAAQPTPRYTRNVAIVLYEGVELLDFAGPAEVFAAAANVGSDGDTPAFEVFTVARTRDPITSQGFLRVTPDHDLASAPRIDILVLPGGASGAVTRDAEMMRWVTERAGAAQVSMSVCTGAAILGRAGLLDGRDVTTWYGAIDGLRAMLPRARVHEGRRFIDTGNIITTAGVSAGIDGALHLVARLLGRNVADGTARYMEYAWMPPAYTAKTYTTWNPSLDDHGRRLQQARALTEERRWDEAEAGLRQLLRDKGDDGAAWVELGATLQEAGRLDAAIAAYETASSIAATRASALVRLAGVYARKDQPATALATLERAVAAGFADGDRLATDPALYGVRGDPRFQKILGALRAARR